MSASRGKPSGSALLNLPVPRGRPRGISKTNALKTHCERGHEFDEPNTYRYIDAAGYPHRECKTCNAIRQRRRYREKGATP